MEDALDGTRGSARAGTLADRDHTEELGVMDTVNEEKVASPEYHEDPFEGDRRPGRVDATSTLTVWFTLVVSVDGQLIRA